ncbi:MAG: fasciclin domain-containing protein [Oceanicaulis sp.]|uniref:fasciclin domain-containing protein n=1 Tax=Glycocaulis sp. TaxID=1969725 RepID=UPI0025C2AD14|nr:fasciclin domain-containing protein [Glycocaulis sp.]MCC5982428.1 fasciclin domain-containing protein [Oceanicaulis sp.]MCH8520620.1 fasciclin domain-containing protein [Glycocaulis sp.]
MRMTALISSTAAAAALLAAPVLADHHSGPADIVDTAVTADDFNTLVAAVEAAGLVDALKGEGPFTVFAPTDEAFAALPEGTVETLLQPENLPQLQAVLTYHVVAGAYTSDIDAGTYNLPTLLGSEVTVIVGEDGTVTVDGANVIAADIEASNGVIHVIDAVILPN